MKKYKIIFWVTTGLIFLTQGVIELMMFRSPETLAGITGLGYPIYFWNMLVAFKVAGCLALIIPQVPARVKEWAYAGFGIDFISAFVSICAVAGFSMSALIPLVAFGVLALSYVSHHKIHDGIFAKVTGASV